jgi:hypothetical protein
MMASMSLQERCSHFGLAIDVGLTLRLTFLSPLFSGHFQFAIAGREDLILTPFELGLGRDGADGAVQPHRDVVLHVPRHDPAGVLQRQRRLGADSVALERLV